MNPKLAKRISILMAFCLVSTFFSMPALASADDGNALGNAPTYRLGNSVNAGLDTGFSEENPIVNDDPHYGWNLGDFYISGFTEVNRADESNPVFLKTAGDQVTLWFRLDQDINHLNRNPNLTIADDTNGFDQYFGVQKTDFGRGTLIIRQTDFENKRSAPQIYTDYLAGVTSQTATQVQLFEEGDYEVALDYEIKDDPRHIPLIGASVFPGYTNYSIRFKFSVRNGNTIVFPFDVATGEELANTAVTENGFYLDLAKSRYLNVNVKRATLSGSGDALVEDVRSNAPAEDGKQYVDEGVYTIAVSNPTTGQTTEKKIYVGSDSLLKAYATTGYPLSEIKGMVSQGAQIDDEGNITWSDGQQGVGRDTDVGGSSSIWIIVLMCVVCIILFAFFALGYKRRHGRTVEIAADDSRQLIEVEVENANFDDRLLPGGTKNEDGLGREEGT